MRVEESKREARSPKRATRNAQHETELYAEPFIRDCLKRFLTRFFAHQFKRSCLPDGPKVGSICLSPRGDWRMPSDASAAEWLRRLDGGPPPRWNAGFTTKARRARRRQGMEEGSR